MKASWDDDFPIYGQIKFMFQTTNQVYIVYNLNIVAIIENQRCPPFHDVWVIFRACQPVAAHDVTGWDVA